MNLTRAIFCVIFPPFAVLDQGCGSVLIVVLLTMAGWVPGVLGAVIIINRNGALNKPYENSFVAAFLLTITLGFIALAIIYILFFNH